MRGREERVGLERLTIRFKLWITRRPMRIGKRGSAYAQANQGSLEAPWLRDTRGISAEPIVLPYTENDTRRDR